MENSIRLLLWLYKPKVNSKGLAPLFLRITIDGKRPKIHRDKHFGKAMGCPKKPYKRLCGGIWLKKLTKPGILKPQKISKTTYYVSFKLMELLSGN